LSWISGWQQSQLKAKQLGIKSKGKLRRRTGTGG